MFCKKSKKMDDPEIFLPKPARIAAILQLCIAFSMILWYGSKPFMGELFSIKSELLLYQHVIGLKHEGHKERFLQLPKPEQEQILFHYAQLQSQLDKPFLAKVKRSLGTLLLDLPPFKMAWIFFSIAIAILLLIRKEGALQAMWILPAFALAYGIDCRLNGTPSSAAWDVNLYPSEQVLIEKYLHEPLNPNVFNQQNQLLKGWELYLILEWAGLTPSPNASEYLEQVAKGDFAFHLNKLKVLMNNPVDAGKVPQEPFPLLALYLFWNLYFVLTVRKALHSPCRLVDQAVYNH